MGSVSKMGVFMRYLKTTRFILFEIILYSFDTFSDKFTAYEHYKNGRYYIFAATLTCIIAPFLVSFVMNSIHGRYRESLLHIPVVNSLIRVMWLIRLTGTWREVDNLSVKVYGQIKADD